MNGAARDAQCLSWRNLDRFSLDSPRQGTLEAINRFLVMIVAMSRRRQALTTANHELKCRHAASGMAAGDKKADRNGTEAERFIRRVHGKFDGLSRHRRAPFSKCHLL